MSITVGRGGQGGNPREIRYCKKCFMPTSRPRVVFDEDGICNACIYAGEKKDIDWDTRKKEFLAILEKYRSKDGSWDCIVPWSGGKDSSSIAHRLKFEYGMNPLLVTFSPMIINEVGVHNREALQQLGFDAVFFRPDQRVHRHLGKRFFIERGNPKVAWDAGVNVVPVQVAFKYKIPLIFYAEHGETEYGGRILHQDSGKMRDFTEVIEHQIGDDPRNWVDQAISSRDLQPYIYPEIRAMREMNLVAYYFAYFHKWSMYENYVYIRDRVKDFKINPRGRTTGTFTNFDSLDDKIDPLYYYMQFIKFGFGRTIRDASRMMQNGHLPREQALEYINKYDGEFPEEHFEEVLDYFQLSREEFTQIVDKHRNPEIWQKVDGKWQLRYPPPQQ